MCPIYKTKLTIGNNVSFSTIPYIFEGFKRLPCCERKECTCEGNGVENVEEENLTKEVGILFLICFG